MSTTEVDMLSQQITSQTSGLEISDTTRIGAGLFALFFGAFLLYFTVFAQASVLHNAAHDTRHAITAPCH
ncbi:MAG: CbtB-domain containing protein [Rhizobiaceae bacterium]|nr:CbtB-domain containing protein [Rhizobiaceae bacterium]